MSQSEDQPANETSRSEYRHASRINIERNEISGNAQVHIGDHIQVRSNPITVKFCAVIVGLNWFASATYDHVQSALRHVWNRLITLIGVGWDMLKSANASDLVCVLSRGSICYSATKVGYAGYSSDADPVGSRGDPGYYVDMLATLCNFYVSPPTLEFKRGKLVIVMRYLLLHVLKALGVEPVVTYTAVNKSSISILPLLYNQLEVSAMVAISPIVLALVTGSEREGRPTPESGMKQSRWTNLVPMALFTVVLPDFILVFVWFGVLHGMGIYLI